MSAGLSGCIGGAKTQGGGDDAATSVDGGTDLPVNAVPFDSVSPASYVTRVKNLLTGLPATDDEIAQVVANPDALKTLIDTWMALPQFQGRMLDFFRNAFQQNQVTLNALIPTLGINYTVNGNYSAPLQRNLMDSFGLTVWNMVQAGKPLNNAITTNQYMMTTAMMAMLSYTDDVQVDDNDKQLVRPYVRHAIPNGFTIDVNETATLAQTLDPTDTANYMHWKVPGALTGCVAPTAVTMAESANMYTTLYGFMFGSIQPYAPCSAANPGNRVNFPTQFQDSDYTDWRLVTINQTSSTSPDTAPQFWDIINMRSATTMTLHTQRIGFFGTLAFDSNWPTNDSNEARVTANQSLIVAIGQSIDGQNQIFNFPVNATDGDHASNPACTGCHSQLDPLKNYFRNSYTLYYHDQLDPTQISAPAGFAIDGVKAQGVGVGDLAQTLASHPAFATAWTTKLHFWATSTAPLSNDAEFIRIATAFKTANFDFKTLVRELFSSPLITLAGPTLTTTTNGIILSMARRDQLCASLSNRLGLTDVCGLTTAMNTNTQNTVANRALLMPTDTYYRGYTIPSLPTSPDLFYRQSTEAVCGLVAAEVIDVSASVGPSRYVSTDPTTAIADFVTTVMGIPPKDPRAAPALAILTDNFNASRASGSSASDSLKATFTLACISPSSVLLGM